MKIQKAQLDQATVVVDFEAPSLTINGVTFPVTDPEALNRLRDADAGVVTPEPPKVTKGKKTPSNESGDATDKEVRAHLQAAGAKGLTGAELRTLCGGKRTAAAIKRVGGETFGDGVGMGRRVRLATPATA